LTQLAERVNKPGSQDAYVYAMADVASVKLRLKDFEGARKDLDASEGVLDMFDSVETVVHAAFYKVNADYYQVRTSLSLQKL
jgi:26S proteasome regulatory subunit N9